MAQAGVDNVSKNQAREFIKRNLKNRHCFALPCPASTEPDLQNLSKAPSTSLPPEFQSQITEIRSRLLRDITPKKWDNKELDCSSFFHLLSELLTQFNAPNTPVLTHITDHIFDSKIDQIRCQIIENFQSEFLAKLEAQLPMDTESMFTDFFREQNESLRKYFSLAKTFLTVNSMSKQYDLLLTNMQSSIEWLEKENEVKSLERANWYLREFDGRYVLPVLKNKESFTVRLFEGVKEDYAGFVKSYNEGCKGPMAKERGLDFLIDHIFAKVGGMWETMVKSFDSHIEDLGGQLVESVKYEKRQKGMIEDQEE